MHQPVHMEDLTNQIVHFACLPIDKLRPISYIPVGGPTRMTLRNMINVVSDRWVRFHLRTTASYMHTYILTRVHTRDKQNTPHTAWTFPSR